MGIIEVTEIELSSGSATVSVVRGRIAPGSQLGPGNKVASTKVPEIVSLFRRAGNGSLGIQQYYRVHVPLYVGESLHPLLVGLQDSQLVDAIEFYDDDELIGKVTREDGELDIEGFFRGKPDLKAAFVECRARVFHNQET